MTQWSNVTRPTNHGKDIDLHIAPMLDVSTPEFLTFMRILTKKAVLWTEMIVDETIVHCNTNDDLDHLLAFTPDLQPIVCQIGGRNEEYCGQATRIVEKYGYQEVNLNMGCPSNRVCSSSSSPGKTQCQFGAILMKQPDVAVRIVSAMKSNLVTEIPISVKTRIGIDEFDTLDNLVELIGKLVNSGCQHFVIHARKCILKGLTPAQNRIIPPLNYPRVYALCRIFPDCSFVLNGGIPGLKVARTLCLGDTFVHDHDNEKEITHHAVPCCICNASNGSCTVAPHIAPPNLKGCMLGRAARGNPAMFADVDRYFYGHDVNPCKNRRDALEAYCGYLERTYPRRCCDNDERVTFRIPAPNVLNTNGNKIGGCQNCQEFYGSSLSQHNHGGVVISEASLLPPKGKVIKMKVKTKMSSRVIDRSLQPVLGFFFGLPKSKTFRRECHRLNKDESLRNCGPGFIIRKAMQKMPDEMLDENFILTEHLNEQMVKMDYY